MVKEHDDAADAAARVRFLRWLMVTVSLWAVNGVLGLMLLWIILMR